MRGNTIPKLREYEKTLRRIC